MLNKFDHIFNLKRIFVFFIIMYLSYLIGNIYTEANLKIFINVAAGIIITLLFFKLSLSISIESIIVFIILLLPFPYFINVGKDLGTTNTIMIYTLTLICWGRTYFKKERLFPEKPFFAIIVCLLLFYTLSFINVQREFLNHSLRKTSVFISCILLFYMIINNIKSEKAIIRILKIIAVISFLEALVVLFLMFFPKYSDFMRIFSPDTNRLIKLTTEGRRIGGTFGFDYGATSVFFSICIFIQILWVQRVKKFSQKIFYFTSIGMSFIAAIATGSRVGLVALMGGLVFIMFFAWDYFNFKKIIIFVLLFVVLFFSFTVYISQTHPETANLYDRFAKRKVDVTQRSAAWKFNLKEALKHPFIGNGLAISHKTETSQVGGRRILVGPRRSKPHNLFLYCILSIGIFGTSCIIVFFGKLFKYAISDLKTDKYEGEIIYIRIIMLGAFVVFLLSQIVTNYLRHSNLQQFVWSIFALLMAASRISRDKEIKKT